jgi:hypothetical protein
VKTLNQTPPLMRGGSGHALYEFAGSGSAVVRANGAPLHECPPRRRNALLGQRMRGRRTGRRLEDVGRRLKMTTGVAGASAVAAQRAADGRRPHGCSYCVPSPAAPAGRRTAATTSTGVTECS